MADLKKRVHTERRERKDQRTEASNKGISIVRKLIITVSILTVVIVSYNLYSIYSDYKKNKVVYDDLKNNYNPEVIDGKDDLKGIDNLDLEMVPEESEVVVNNNDADNTIMDVKLSDEKYDELKSLNSDFAGWITIPNTDISYPMVQNKNDDQYYLTHNFYNENNSGGAIFIDKASDPAFISKNTFIHGHNMRNGSMFGTLSNFLNKSFFDENDKIYIALRGETYVYQVFSTYEESYNKDTYASHPGEEAYKEYLDWIINKSNYKFQNTNSITTKTNIITLSTCGYDTSDGRILVHAKLIGVE